jgi:hypothetical protein
MPSRSTPKGASKSRPAPAADLGARIIGAISEKRLAAKFIEGYAAQFDRAELIVHKERNREVESILEKEILLAMLARVVHTLGEISKTQPRRRGEKNQTPDPNRFVREVVSAIGAARNWTAGDSVEVLGELDLYRAIMAKNAPPAGRASSGGQFGSSFRRSASSGPFVDRCAFVLDPSMMENARVSSAKVLREIELLADQLLEESLRATQSRS